MRDFYRCPGCSCVRLMGRTSDVEGRECFACPSCFLLWVPEPEHTRTAMRATKSEYHVEGLSPE